MALTADNKILASDFIDLKKRVKAEMERRNQVDSLASYAATTYDYTVTPSSEVSIKVEHINKIVEPIDAIKNTGYGTAQVGDTVIKALDGVETQLAAHEVYPMYGSGTDCAAGCSGLCSSGCAGTCTSCTGTCTGTCTANCANNCSGSCSGSCAVCTGCSGCGGSCSSNCSGCSGTCSGSCSGGCSGGCKGCRGCGGSCSSKCASTCTWGCAS